MTTRLERTGRNSAAAIALALLLAGCGSDGDGGSTGVEDQGGSRPLQLPNPGLSGAGGPLVTSTPDADAGQLDSGEEQTEGR